jgi:hypothetical protein
MKTCSIVMIRLYEYKSFRHYAGREITSIPHICPAKFIEEQRDHTFVVELLEPCMLFKIGYKIAVLPKDFNI